MTAQQAAAHPPSGSRRALRAAGWGLTVTGRSLRFVPPLLALLVFLGLFFVQGGQAAGSVVAADVIATFSLAIWFTLAHLGAMPRGHRDITQATVGRAAHFAGDGLGALVLGCAAGLLSVGWASVLGIVRDRPDAAGTAAWCALVCVAALAGVAAGSLLHCLPLGAPARFVAAVGVVALVLARPALPSEVSWPIPAAMDIAKATNASFPPGAAAGIAAVGTVAWSVVALALAAWSGSRWSGPE